MLKDDYMQCLAERFSADRRWNVNPEPRFFSGPCPCNVVGHPRPGTRTATVPPWFRPLSGTAIRPRARRSTKSKTPGHTTVQCVAWAPCAAPVPTAAPALATRRRPRALAAAETPEPDFHHRIAISSRRNRSSDRTTSRCTRKRGATSTPARVPPSHPRPATVSCRKCGRRLSPPKTRSASRSRPSGGGKWVRTERSSSSANPTASAWVNCSSFLSIIRFNGNNIRARFKAGRRILFLAWVLTFWPSPKFWAGYAIVPEWQTLLYSAQHVHCFFGFKYVLIH